MRKSDRMARNASSRSLCLGVVMAGALLVAACGSSTSSSNSGSTTTANAGSTASLLGPTAKATGTPVKVGLISDGGTCPQGCLSGDELPAAQATVAWANEHMNGLGGHPMTLDVCVDDIDPGKASDCANQMIRDKVVAVVVGASGVIENSWKILHGAHIPVVNLSSVSSSMLKDTASTFLLNDPAANTIAFPIGVAKDKGAKKISVIVVDLPPATEIFKAAKDEFTKNGIELQVVPAPLVTPDMTPQAQQVVSNNPDGLAFVVGNDEFCIPAFNGLHAVGFTGTISAISQCFTAATRKAVPGSVLNGMEFSSIAPAGEQSDPSQQQWQAILDTYAGGKHVDASGLPGYGMFQSFGALAVGSKTLQGEVTPASVIAALKGMKNEILPGSGNRWFRCNGKASQQSPAVCSVSVLAGTLDASGNPTTYKVVNNSQIPD